MFEQTRIAVRPPEPPRFPPPACAPCAEVDSILFLAHDRPRNSNTDMNWISSRNSRLEFSADSVRSAARSGKHAGDTPLQGVADKWMVIVPAQARAQLHLRTRSKCRWRVLRTGSVRPKILTLCQKNQTNDPESLNIDFYRRSHLMASGLVSNFIPSRLLCLHDRSNRTRYFTNSVLKRTPEDVNESTSGASNLSVPCG